MNIKDIITQLVVALTTTAIASLIGYLFKGRFVSMFKRFFNSSEKLVFKLIEFFIPVFLLFYVFFTAFVEVLETKQVESIILLFISFFFYTLFIVFATRMSIDTSFSSFSYILGEIKEKKRWLDRISKPEFICNVDGISVAFYVLNNHIDYAPVHVDDIDLSVWVKVDKKLFPLVKSVDSIDKLKSALGCG